MEPMTREKALSVLKSLEDHSDTEYAHGEADAVLCDFLTALGYGDVVEAYERVDKWYA